MKKFTDLSLMIKMFLLLMSKTRERQLIQITVGMLSLGLLQLKERETMLVKKVWMKKFMVSLSTIKMFLQSTPWLDKKNHIQPTVGLLNNGKLQSLLCKKDQEMSH
jgi:hypothetical protein